MNEYDNLIQSGENVDLGLSIQNLINDNLKFIQTAFLAKITKISNNKVSIKPLLKSKESDKTLIINNCLVGFNFSLNWQTQFKLRVGDIGVALVLQNDITSYKNTGKEGLNDTSRFKDINDSIFLPFSMFKSLNNDNVNFLIENHNKKCKLEFDNAENGKLKARLLTLESETTTLKRKLLELTELLENMASGNTSATGHGHVVTTSPSSIGKFKKWYNGLNELFLN